ncbi:MAG TPA: hypothetical protein VHY56_06925 [Candidatus Binataceae bacterium]|jgi:hypothetical protein|nr:hypothetical protein [Candidatus Binataceae bacterium]
MATDNLFGISEAIRKASESYVQALTTVTKALQTLASQANSTERDRLVENWLRIARMSKDGIITALESGFQYWENEIRRNAAATRSTTTATEGKNPMEAWAENWRAATEAFTTGPAGSWTEELRKQSDAVQKSLQEGIRQWQQLWEPEKK